ncbi:MAG TPA: molecular chaperone DnaK, partial [Planctomycetota bacterium]|jgi:hypothetical protein|nr:molecular chaperone DnaK [Planctomycetota bacterium]
MDDLQQALYKISEQLYKTAQAGQAKGGAPGGEAAGGEAKGGAPGGGTQGKGGGSGDDNIVDAEFEVKDH